MNLFKMLSTWHARRLRERRAKMREIDKEILWPVLKDLSEDIHFARRAFIVHAINDDNWADLTDAEIVAEVDKLQ